MAEIARESELATEKNENEIANRDTVGLSQKQIILRRFIKHKAAMASLVVLISIIIFVFTASGLQIGKNGSALNLRGWWPYLITDIDPEGAVAASCNGGVSGCPTLDLTPSFIDGDGIQIGFNATYRYVPSYPNNYYWFGHRI